MGALRDRLRAELDPVRRQEIKAEAINERVDALVGRSVVRGNFTLTLTDLEVAPSPGGPVVVLSVSVVNNTTGRDVTPDDLNPITFVNPPLLVPDPDGDVDLGTPEHPRRFREDVPAALLESLEQLLRSRVG